MKEDTGIGVMSLQYKYINKYEKGLRGRDYSRLFHLTEIAGICYNRGKVLQFFNICLTFLK